MYPGFKSSSIVVSFALAWLTRWWGLARHGGGGDEADRWHNKPTAMLGGSQFFDRRERIPFIGQCRTPYGWVVMLGSVGLFVVGLVDDILHIKPYQKLIGQVMGASLIVYYGLSLPWSASPSLNMAITIFWLIGITNALNLLDNMDGLAAGIAAIAAAFLSASFLVNGRPAEACSASSAPRSSLPCLHLPPRDDLMGVAGRCSRLLSPPAPLMRAAGARSRCFSSCSQFPVLI